MIEIWFHLPLTLDEWTVHREDLIEIVLAIEKHEREKTTIPEITNTVVSIEFFRHVLQKKS